MILVSHERSGSEFFCRAIPGFTYVQYEIFGQLDQLQLTSRYDRFSVDAKIALLKAHPPNKIHKIHARQIVAAPPALFEFLSTRKDLYFLERRDLRASVQSLIIASKNKNFHGDPEQLKPITMTRADVARAVQFLKTDVDRCRDLPYVERFVLEDLLSGSLPKTLPFDTSISPIKKRGSSEMKLILNEGEMNEYFVEFGI